MVNDLIIWTEGGPSVGMGPYRKVRESSKRA